MRNVLVQPRPTARRLGFAMVIVGSGLWGLSGTAAQVLFETAGVTPGWLVAVRMLVSGLALLMWARVGLRLRVTAVWRTPADRLRLLLFALLGLFGVQYTYFASIAAGNAAAATFLQYLGPVLIAAYVAVRARRWPTQREQTAILLAVVGTFLLVTGGAVRHLAVPWPAVVWGLLSAAALAFYTLYPAPLLERWNPALVSGWGMTAGGVAAAVVCRPWQGARLVLSGDTLLLVLFVVVFGTLVPFYLYIASLRHVTPSETSLAACFEPLSAAAASVMFLHVQLSWTMLLGGLCIISTLIVLTARPISGR